MASIDAKFTIVSTLFIINPKLSFVLNVKSNIHHETRGAVSRSKYVCTVKTKEKKCCWVFVVILFRLSLHASSVLLKGSLHVEYGLKQTGEMQVSFKYKARLVRFVQD